MLTLEEIGELFGNPEKFFQRPERKDEGAKQVFANILPFIVLFSVGGIVVSVFLEPAATYELRAYGLLLIFFLAIIVFAALAIPLKLLGHPISGTFKAFMYGAIPFLLVGWLLKFIVIISLFSVYWGIVTLQKAGRVKAIAVMVVPILMILFWADVLALIYGAALQASSISGVSQGEIDGQTYTNNFYGFSIETAPGTEIEQDGECTYFRWMGGQSQQTFTVMYVCALPAVLGTMTLEELFSEMESACERTAGCTMLSQRRTQFLGRDSFETLEQTTFDDGSPALRKIRIFFAENGRSFYISCTLYEEEYEGGMAGCEQVASTFRTME